MTHWLSRPLVGFDLETTSPDPENARIVTACVGHANSGGAGSWRPRNLLVNPGVPIPAEATAIHGVTDEQAAAGEPPGDAAMAIAMTLQGVWTMGQPVIMHNAPYDLTVLDRELRRHCGVPLQVNGPVIDTLVLDKATDRFRKGSRRLEDTCRHYGVEIGAAHTADADCFAAVRLAWHLVVKGRVRTQAGMVDLSSLTPGDLTEAQRGWYAEQRESFAAYRRRRGEPLDDESTDWPVRTFRG